MYYNPVKVIETDSWQTALTKSISELNIYNPLVITSFGNIKRIGLLNLFDKRIIFSEIENNPTLSSCQLAIDFSRNNSYDGVIAIGGGSVMDTAKTVMAAMGTEIYELKKLFSLKSPFPHRMPAIFIPTTHGTASEVTMWSTIWDMIDKKKYSISYPELYPDVAILDGSLTLSLPLELSITTILDALSHSFEAIWNKNASEKTNNYAIEAISIILQNVKKLKKNRNGIETRNSFLKASNLAGLAFSNTKTAAAHSISYPLTISYGIPHGIACSMPVIPLLKINEKAIKSQLEMLFRKTGINSLSELEKIILNIPENIIKFNLRDWNVNKSHLEDIVERSFTKDRMGNNIVDLNSNDVLGILKEIF